MRAAILQLLLCTTAAVALPAGPAQAADPSRAQLTGFMNANHTPLPRAERPAHAAWRSAKPLRLALAEPEAPTPLALQGTLTLGGERYRVVLNLGNP